VLVEMRRRRSVLFALLVPSGLALLATTCSATPPATAPTTEPPPADAGAPGWTMPGVPLAAPRTVILLQPRPVAPDAAAIRATPPDPPALVERGQWVYDLRYDRGEIFLKGVHRIELPAPRETPRMMGRFALELYSGPTLIERVRFDFPGLGGAEPAVVKNADGGVRQPLHGASFSFTSKLTTRVGVTLPATSRGTRLELWDRATDRRWPLPWPAVETTLDAVDAGDAGQ
jgi:hypothetical protein